MTIPHHIQEVYAKATCLFSKHEIEAAIDQMARQIHNDLSDQNPVLLCVMIGGLVLTGNLLPRLDFPLELDYIHATRYQGAMQGGELFWKGEPKVNLKDRTVLIVDDILDGGLTLSAIEKYCAQAGAKAVQSAVLVNREMQRLPGGTEKASYVGLNIGNGFIFGYGLDYKEYLRNAPGIYVVAPEHAV
jgi:hypoxanthine phosphoribosyltransferase